MKIIRLDDRNRRDFESFLPERVKGVLELGVIDEDIVVGAVRLDLRDYAIHILSMEFGEGYESRGIYAVLDYVYELAMCKNYPIIVMAACEEDEYELEKYRRYGFSFIETGARYSFSIADLKLCNMVKKLMKDSSGKKNVTLNDVTPIQEKCNPELREIINEKRVDKGLSTAIFNNDKLQSMCIIGNGAAASNKQDGDSNELELMYLYAAKDANMQLLVALRESFNKVCKSYTDDTIISCTTTGASAENLITGFNIPNIELNYNVYMGNAFVTDMRRLLDIFGRRYA